MFSRHSSTLYNILKEQRAVPEAQLESAHDEYEATGTPLADGLVAAGLIQKQELLRRVGEHLGYDFLPDLPAQFPPEVIAAVRSDLARDYGVMPLRLDERGVDLVLVDPLGAHACEDLTFALGRPVRLFVGDPDQVETLIRRHYGAAEDGIAAVLEELGTGGVGPAAGGSGEALSERDLESMAEQAPIIKLVDLVIGQAIRDHASDIHFEPFEHEFKIRYRIDGALYEMAPPPAQLALPIISRVKVLASMNIAERRLPQDGRLKMLVGGRAVDLRVSTLPTQFGESVVLRVLDSSAVQLDLSQLGMPAEVFDGMQEMLRQPNGIVVVTGPTGSGKTTTLYSGLRIINRTGLKLLTAEDPVEYEIEGIMQVPVNPAVGLTFASALRSFLRQDPDVIMVGEIRDLETAQIAIQASLTGHLVLSTLHTNDAAGAVTRLVDMGIEPFLIASTLEAVLAQRLVRRVCTHCKATYLPEPDLVHQLGLEVTPDEQRPFVYGAGCSACNETGYKGRLGIYEWLRMSEGIRELVTQRAPTLTIRQTAMKEGMRTLREAGVRAIFDGHTSAEEIIKHT